MSPRDRTRAQPKSKKPSLLDEALERRMLLYVLAAGSTLAGASVAQAKVVFTPSHSELLFHYQRFDNLNIDLNHDGTKDFTLTIASYSEVGVTRLYTRNIANNSVEVGHNALALALQPGDKIGSSAEFGNYGILASALSGKGFGGFANTSERYLAVRFQLDGAFHYGWIGFRKVVAGPSIYLKARLQGWAYETEADKPIIADDKGAGDKGAGDKGPDESADLSSVEPTSLELLAMGHTAIAERRRRIAS